MPTTGRRQELQGGPQTNRLWGKRDASGGCECSLLRRIVLFLLTGFKVLSFLLFLSARFNDEKPVSLRTNQRGSLVHTEPSFLQWGAPDVIWPLMLAVVSISAFVVIELCIASEPVLAPFLLRQKFPVLNGLSNFFVANCTFTIMYFFPMWFQTVALTNASTAGSLSLESVSRPRLKACTGLHMLPNSISMSCGSMFAGYVKSSFRDYPYHLTIGNSS